MLVELTEREVASMPDRVNPGMRFPLLMAVMQGLQRGQVYANKRDAPDAFAVITRFGFMGAFGAVDAPEFASGLARLLGTAGMIAPSYLLWYSPSPEWQVRLDRDPAAFRRRERLRFRFNRNLASYLVEREKPAGGIELLRLDADLVAAAAPLGVQLESRFWSSAEDFLRNGVGVCAVAAGQVVGLCYSACIADGHAEVDVAVDVKFRRRGIASLVTREFVRECTNRCVEPTWDCFTANEASMRLAVSLGFERTLAYPLYSFNVPVNLRPEPVQLLS